MYLDNAFISTGEKYRKFDGFYGVSKFKKHSCYNGFTLFSPCWGDQSYLIDMRGLVVHSWDVNHCNYSHITDSGCLLTQDCGNKIQKLDHNSETIWEWGDKSQYEIPTHHDFYYDEREELIYTLAAKFETTKPNFYNLSSIPDVMKNDYIVVIDKNRSLIWQFSIIDHLQEILDQIPIIKFPFNYQFIDEYNNRSKFAPSDWAHANSIYVIQKKPIQNSNILREGNILVSLRRIDTIIIIDPNKNKIVWSYGPGELDGQHQVSFTNNGEILLFDNGSVRGVSEVKTINPLPKEVTWSYSNERIYSSKRSGVQLLPNGNYLICEGDAGHLLELCDNEIVWEYWSPFIPRSSHHMGRRVHRATRYSKEKIIPILDARKDFIDGQIDSSNLEINNYKELIELYIGETIP